MNQDASTFTALLTGDAAGAIGVVGVAGVDADRIVLSICETVSGERLARFERDRPRLVRIRDGDDVIDDAIVTAIASGPMSRIEICTHGGVRIVERVIEVLRRRGAIRLAGGAFEDRFGGSDPVQRDVDKALIRAGSRKLAKWLMAQRRILPAFLGNWERLSETERSAFRSRSEVGIRLVRGLQIALAGPPNAGKSTLANRLIGHRRVIVSDVAGTTRDWVDETAMIDGWPVTLTDTAGVRQTSCDLEREAIRRGSDRVQTSDLVLVVVDANASPTDRTRSIQDTIEALRAAPRLIVLNKIDMAPGGVEVGAGTDELAISALSGDGVELLERRIGRMLGIAALDSAAPTGFLPAHLAGQAETIGERSEL